MAVLIGFIIPLFCGIQCALHVNRGYGGLPGREGSVTPNPIGNALLVNM